MSTDDVTTKIKRLREAAQRVHSAQTASKKHEALMIFDHRLDIDYAFPTYGKEHISAWTGVCTSRLWEVFIDLLTVPVPDLRNMPPFKAETELSVRYMCASFATNLVHGCTRYAGSNSAMTYLRSRLSRIVLYHHTWVVGDINVRSEVVQGFKGGIIKVLCIAVSSGVKSDNILSQLNRDMVLQLIFSYVLDPNTYDLMGGNAGILNVADGLLELGFDNRFSAQAAGWAVAKYGPSNVANGFLKYSQIVTEEGEVGDFVAPLILASHLLAAQQVHSTLMAKHGIHVLCINIYWGKLKIHPHIDGTPVRSFSVVIIDFINAALGVVQDPKMQAVMIQELMQRADLIVLLASACLHPRHDEDREKAAAIGKQISVIAKSQPYILTFCSYIQRCLESLDRTGRGIGGSSQRGLELWRYIGQPPGWAATSEAILNAKGPKGNELKGCSWLRCPSIGSFRNWLRVRLG